MTRAFLTQTNFTSGELDPRMLGRTDLRSFENGAAKLRNVVVDITGGVRRRPGTRHVIDAAGPGRLVAFQSGADQDHLLVFTDLRVDVYRDGSLEATLTSDVPWSSDRLAKIAWAQRGSSLVVTHPDAPPRQITRQSDGSWTVAPLPEIEPSLIAPSRAPFTRFVGPDVTIQGEVLTTPDAGETVNLTASEPLFTSEHQGSIVRIGEHQIVLTSITGAPTTEAEGQFLQDYLGALDGDGNIPATTNWDELAFSDARGWPATVSFHQNRMVFGGSRDLPNGLWFSKTGRMFDFDFGEGLDDEAIGFRLVANDSPEIRALFAGRHLQVFTSSGEWIVRGDPLTPTNIQVEQQSGIGSPRDRHVPPRDVDGATLFAARNGREIREFLFASIEQAYQADDLALLSRHLVNDPVDQVFDQRRRLFLVVMADGALGALAIHRNADVVAWSLFETAGRVLSVAIAGEETLLLVEREQHVFIEALDDTFLVDAGVRLSAATPSSVWDGLDHLEGRTVTLVADGLPVGDAVVESGTVALATPARDLTAGLPYAHVIEPLPSLPTIGRALPQDPAYRPIRVTLRLFETQAVRIDTGDGLREVPLHEVGEGPADRPPSPFTGDRALRALGWRRGIARPPWRIEQSTPLPCTLLSATTEVMVND